MMKRILGALTLAAATLIPAAAAHAQVGIAVQIRPPAPAYYYGAYAPPCPGPDYYWTPGYYAGRVWVPGRWVYRAYYGPRYYHHDEYYRHDHDWDDHDHGRHNGWYKHHDDDDWRR
jgi:hypothetical protein